jgi:shikimate kinase
MGSGKSAVGRRLARLLGWRFLDMDREIERDTGRKVARIFDEDGETRFRELEHRTACRLLREEQAVIASGGGWPCFPDRMSELGAGTLAIWLVVSAETAVARAEASWTRRPLLEVEDPLEAARELLAHREPFYRQAHWQLRADDRSPDSLARELRSRLLAESETT